MEIDGSAAEDDAGCYVLDISIRGAEGKIWVRAEYLNLQRHSALKMCPTRCLHVITGQPGTGELSDVVIILVLLGSHILPPVIFYLNDACWLFVEEGVFEKHPHPSRHGITKLLFGYLSTR